jgi:hypothetical protein
MKLRLFAAGLASAALLAGAARAQCPRPALPPTVATCRTDMPAVTDDTPQIAVEVRLVSVSDEFVKEHGEELGLTKKKGRRLSDGQVRRLLEALQADPKTNVMQAPKVTLLDGQRAEVRVGQDCVVAANVEAVPEGGRVVARVTTSQVTSGFEMHLTPRVSEDHRRVLLDVQVSTSELTASPVVPVTVLVSPEDLDTGEEGLVERTVYLRKPEVSEHNIVARLNLKDGRTALVPGWTATHEVPAPEVPMLGALPLIGCLFRGEAVKETEHVFLLVTPRIIVDEEHEARVPVRPTSRSGANADQGCRVDVVPGTSLQRYSATDIGVRMGAPPLGEPFTFWQGFFESSKAEEKAPARVGRIVIVGNTCTRHDLIMSQIPVYPGQILNESDLQKAERNLARLGIFKHTPDGSVRPKVTILNPDTDGEYKDILVTVEEDNTGCMILGLGVNSDAGLAGTIVLNERNFDITRVPTSLDDLNSGNAFRGAGQEMRVEAVPGTMALRYSVGFREPAPCGFGVSVRVGMPVLNPAPIALDFGFPVARRPDCGQVFNFVMGFFH